VARRQADLAAASLRGDIDEIVERPSEAASDRPVGFPNEALSVPVAIAQAVGGVRAPEGGSPGGPAARHGGGPGARPGRRPLPGNVLRPTATTITCRRCVRAPRCPERWPTEAAVGSPAKAVLRRGANLARSSRMNSILTAACLIAAAALLGCRGDGGGAGAEATAAGGVADAYEVGPPVMLADAPMEARSRALLDERLDEIEAAVQRLPGLIGSIRQDMRRHLNATHVEAARRNGIGPVRDSAHQAALVRRGALVQLPDSTRWWVLRELDQSLPFVTPGTKAALEEVGRRFHARLDEHGLPPFRLDITSVLRTSQQQSALRRRNPNASATTSSHEFGTTLDIAYLSFAAPHSIDHGSLALEPDVQISRPLRAELISALDSLGTRYAPHLEGELGAVLQQLQRDGMVLILRERSQPVYHITVARDP